MSRCTRPANASRQLPPSRLPPLHADGRRQYALHKLLVYGERPQAQRTKARKDVAQAAALIDYLLTHDTEEMGAMWIDVNSRGPGWRKRLQEGFDAMHALYPQCDFPKQIHAATA
ncbi:MAG: GSU2403 family nucleotidyltransferase fold protein [Rhodoferax sp.]|nr:GSU2403 family nucleotidyltransferase fold protein [Rhodoferax sp.]MDP3652277.1 GSU2403 family nucleotidyltransferase fold protein [Rhodoferax sp.]